MKAKVLPIALLVAAVSATNLFANGTNERAPGPWGRGPEAQQQKVEVTGQLSLKSWHPTIKSGGDEYTLMVPRRYTYNIDVKEGDTIKVEGFAFDEGPWCVTGTQKGLLVTKAVINGKEYVVDSRDSFGPMGAGPGGPGGPGMMRGGMMGPRGWR
jgi:hypothetical protein